MMIPNKSKKLGTIAALIMAVSCTFAPQSIGTVLAADTAEPAVNATLGSADVSVRYFYGASGKSDSSLTVNNKITVGDEITSGGDYNKLPKLFNGSANGNEVYIGANGSNNRYIVVDLGENHENVSEIVLKNVYQQVLVMMANSISTTKGANFIVDYTQRIRSNSGDTYNPNSLGIVKSKGSQSGDVVSQYKLWGSNIGNYRYIILHCNGSRSLVDELELKYINSGTTVAKVGSARYSTLDAAVTAANNATEDCTIRLMANASQSVKLNPNVNVTLSGNGKTITGSGTLYQTKASSAKKITVDNAVLNVSNTSTTAPAFATTWKTGSNITVKNSTVTADTILYSINDSTFKITGNTKLNGTVYVYVGSKGTETTKHRARLDLDGYTGTSNINVKLAYVNDPTGNHSNYAAGDTVMVNASGVLNKIKFTDSVYELATVSGKHDLVLQPIAGGDGVEIIEDALSGSVSNIDTVSMGQFALSN